MDWLRHQPEAITTPLPYGRREETTASVSHPGPEPSLRAAPNTDYVEIKEAGHEILMERNPIRAEFWRAFDAFMSRHAPFPTG